MRVCDLSTGSARLHEAWQTLRHRWLATAELWDDSVSRNFEQEHLAPLEPQVLAAIDRLRRLSQVMAKAEEECSG